MAEQKKDKKRKSFTIKARKNMSLVKLGKKNPNWKDGISFNPYPLEFNKQLKEEIRKRDNYQCQNKECNMTEEEHLIVYGIFLYIHHIDYDKQNCKEENLTTLCLQCNCRVNYNRKYWKEIFQKELLCLN